MNYIPLITVTSCVAPVPFGVQLVSVPAVNPVFVHLLSPSIFTPFLFTCVKIKDNLSCGGFGHSGRWGKRKVSISRIFIMANTSKPPPQKKQSNSSSIDGGRW